MAPEEGDTDGLGPLSRTFTPLGQALSLGVVELFGVKIVMDPHLDPDQFVVLGNGGKILCGKKRYEDLAERVDQMKSVQAFEKKFGKPDAAVKEFFEKFWGKKLDEPLVPPEPPKDDGLGRRIKA